MKIVSQATNQNNSRVTIEFKDGGLLSRAEEIAKKHGCGFSHNVRIEVGVDSPKSFGTVSFNKGEHAAALAEFLHQASYFFNVSAKRANSYDPANNYQFSTEAEAISFIEAQKKEYGADFWRFEITPVSK